MWDPSRYARFAGERARPFTDLLARVGASAPRAVVDLGCGPGDRTTTLAQRWPAARITGIDSSPAMIERARTLDTAVRFELGDIADWQPEPDVDVVVCNAVLQWVPEHAHLLRRWAAQLAPDSWLAVGVPGNFGAPSHRALRAVATDHRWATDLAGLLREAPVQDAAGYAALLTDAGCAVDAWETTYVHVLVDDDAEHPVLRWMDGTALGPVRAVLGDDEVRWPAFRQELGRRLRTSYPPRGGRVLFPFRRIFVVARTGQPTQERP